MKKFYRRNAKWINIVAIVLVTVLVVGIVGVATNSFAKLQNNSVLGLREPNNDNLIKVDDYEDLHDTETNGITVTVKDDGTIVLDGKATAATTITLKTIASTDKIITGTAADGFVLSGITDGSFSTVRLAVKQSSNTLATSTKYPAVFSGFSAAEATVVIEIADDAKLENVKINPVLVKGADSVSFYG